MRSRQPVCGSKRVARARSSATGRGAPAVAPGNRSSSSTTARFAEPIAAGSLISSGPSSPREIFQKTSEKVPPQIGKLRRLVVRDAHAVCALALQLEVVVVLFADVFLPGVKMAVATDSNPGTSAAPFRTVARGIQAVSAG